jgi:hypothetical protein
MAAFKRAGLHPLDCPSATCHGYVYATVAQLEALGLPCCPCGTAYVPREVELAELLGLEDCAAVDEYRREIESVWHGQEAHASRLGRTLRDPHELAMSRIVKRRRDDARRRRVSALLPTPEPMPF